MLAPALQHRGARSCAASGYDHFAKCVLGVCRCPSGALGKGGAVGPGPLPRRGDLGDVQYILQEASSPSPMIMTTAASLVLWEPCRSWSGWRGLPEQCL